MNPRRQPVRGRIVLPVPWLAVEGLVTSRRRLRVAAEEGRFERVHVRSECLASSCQTARFPFAFRTAEDADGGFEKDWVRYVASGLVLVGCGLRISGRVARRRCGCTGGGLDGRQEGCEGGFRAGAVSPHHRTSLLRKGGCAAVNYCAWPAGRKVRFAEDVLACCSWFDRAKTRGGEAHGTDLVARVPFRGWHGGVAAYIRPRHCGVSPHQSPGGAFTEISGKTVFDASVAATV